MRARKLLGALGSFLLAGVLLYFFLGKADLAHVAAEASRASAPYLLLAIAGEVVAILLRVWRWRLMLRTVRERVSFADLLKATVVSFAMTGVLPGRIGELARPYFLAKWQGLPFSPVMASSLLERGMDLIAIVLLWFAFIFFGGEGVSSQSEGAMRVLTRISYGLMALFVPAGLFLWWLARRRRVYERIARRSERLRRFPLTRKGVRFLLAFAEGLGTFRRKRDILSVTALSMASWGVLAVTAWCIPAALHAPLPAGSGLLIIMFVSFGAAIPTPGGIGGVHKAIQVALVLFYAMEEDKAVAAGIVGHAVMFFPGILWGLLYLAFGRVRFREIREELRQGGLPPAGETRDEKIRVKDEG